MPRWWPRPSLALDGSRACAATWKLRRLGRRRGQAGLTTLQVQRCVRLRACRMQRTSEGAAPLHTHMLHGSSSKKRRIEKTAEIARHRERHVFATVICGTFCAAGRLHCSRRVITAGGHAVRGCSKNRAGLKFARGTWQGVITTKDAIALRSPASERSPDLKRYSPDIHDERNSRVRLASCLTWFFAVESVM